MSPLRWHLRQASQTHLVQKVFSSKPVWIDCLSDFSRWQPHPSSGSGLNVKCYLFSHIWQPFYKQSLLALSSKYIWNLTTSYYLHYYLNYCNSGLPDLILPPTKVCLQSSSGKSSHFIRKNLKDTAKLKNFTVIPLYTNNRAVLFKMTDCVAPLLKTPQQLTSFKEEKPISYCGLQDPARSGPYYHSSLLSITLQPHWPPLCSSNMVSTFLL